MAHATLLLNGKEFQLPTTVGSENELAIDISSPAAPKRLGGVDVPGLAESIEVSGATAIIATTTGVCRRPAHDKARSMHARGR